MKISSEQIIRHFIFEIWNVFNLHIKNSHFICLVFINFFMNIDI